jgi:hypothetical protein
MSTARARVCLYCGRKFISTSPGERQCEACAASQAGARERAATVSDARVIKELLESMFDLSIWSKARWAAYFEMRRHALRNAGDAPAAETRRVVKHAEAMMKLFA